MTRALAYLELHYARHQCAAVLRSPLRLVIWVPYLLSIVYLAFLRVTSHHHSALISVSAQQPRFATLIGGLYLATLGASAGIAAAGRVAAFRTGAEAVLFSNAGIRPLAMALWLQARKLALGSFRWSASLAYLFVMAAPHQASSFALLRTLFAAFASVGLLITCELPAFLLSRRLGPMVGLIAWTVAACGAVYATAAALGPRFREPLLAVVRLDPGTFTAALLGGRPSALLTVSVVLAAFVASILWFGADALPELYAVTQRTLAVRNRRRRFVSETTFAGGGAGADARIPAGALALIWKDWIAFRRGRGVLRLWLIGAGFWSLCGAGVAYAALRWDDPSPIFSLVGMSATLVLISAPFGASIGLAADLAKPMFWLSNAPLRARLAAWTFARAWRGGTAIALAPLAAGIVASDVVLAAGALPLSLVTYWSLQALGVGLYALFPNPVDSRGPMTLLRLFLTGVYIVPACAAATLAGMLGLSPLDGGAAFAVTLAVEGWLVIEAASYRFAEHGASLATLSRAN